MRFVLLPLRNSKEGRKRGEFPLGTVSYREPQIEMEVPDRRTCARLREHFSQTYRVRIFRGAEENVMAHGFEELAPGSERHFDEGLRRLPRLDLIAILESELI